MKARDVGASGPPAIDCEGVARVTSLPNRRPRNPMMADSVYRRLILSLYFENYQTDPTFKKQFDNLARAYAGTRSVLGLDPATMPEPDDWSALSHILLDSHEDWSTLSQVAQHSGSDAAKKFVAELEQFGRRWGLACFPDNPDDEGFDDGLNALVIAMRYWSDNPKQRPFLQRSTLDSIPRVDGTVRQGRRQLLPIHFESTWNPLQQTPGEAIEELLNEFGTWVRHAVLEGHQRYLLEGYKVSQVPLKKKVQKTSKPEDDAQELERDLRWLYLRVAYRKPWEMIAAEEGSTDGYVRKRATYYQRLLGIRLPRSGPRNR